MIFYDTTGERIGPVLVKNPPKKILKKYLLKEKDFFTNEPTTIKLFMQYNDNEVLLPRYCPYVNIIDENLSEGQDIEIICEATPRDEIQEKATNFIVDNYDCIINLAPRRGKTVISIMAISKIKKKTLILVDQTNLLEQWIERIVEFTNLEKSDIGIFRGDKQEFEKPIVIGMVQTIKNHVEQNIKEIRTKFKDFGLVIVDEIHAIVGTEKLGLPLYSISAKRLVGLSATIFRSDGREFLFHEWFGHNVFSSKKYDIDPIIYMFPINNYITYKELSYIMKNYFKDGDELKSQVFFNKLKWSKKFQSNKLSIFKVGFLIYNMFKNNKTILVISDHIDLLQHLANTLYYMFGIDLSDIELYTDSGGVTKQKMEKKKKEQEKKETVKKTKRRKKKTQEFIFLEPTRNLDKRITLSTYKMCNKAIDRPDWDRLIMLTPISVNSPSLEQTIGRVCTLCKGKSDAAVIDIFDPSVPRSYKMAVARQNFYLKSDFIVKNKID